MASILKSHHGHTRTPSTEHRTLWFWKRLFGKEPLQSAQGDAVDEEKGEQTVQAEQEPVAKRLPRCVVPGLPRAGTFKRQQSEQRERLEPDHALTRPRRTQSVDRKRATSASSSSPTMCSPRMSAPDLLERCEKRASRETLPAPSIGELMTREDTQSLSSTYDDLERELERRWILNLSMHFRDKSNREKFFVTFAETPNYWRRVTVSLDYRHAAPGSLEEDLEKTTYQRDKSAKIYEAIRGSLADIQFYNTVTNLKLQTEDQRLHVHVVEDLAEIISYPPVRVVSHLDCPRIREDELVFDSHLSGFVYKVIVDGNVWIKKEIP